MPRVDIRHLGAKDKLKAVVSAAERYAELMAQQNRPAERIIVAKGDYEALHRRAQPRHPNRTVVLCIGDTLVHWHRDPIDESDPVLVSRYPAVPTYDLPPVTANPFGVAPAPVQSATTDDGFDDDIPF